MAVKELKLTRSQVEEIVGNDQRKVKAIEGSLNSAIIQDNLVVPSGTSNTWWVTKWRNGKLRMRARLTTAAAFSTFKLPDTLSGNLDLVSMIGSSYGSTSAQDITIKFATLTSTTVDIGATVNGALAAVACSVIIEGRWKEEVA